MKRFTGPGGKTRQLDAFRMQALVAGDLQIAKELVKSSNLRNLRANHQLMTQGGTDNDIYFILSGSVSVIVNGRDIAIRKAGEHVGEIALIDPTARRSATIRTLEPTVVACISEGAFTRIANKHPGLWRRIAVVLARRLRERNRFQTEPRSEPVVFLGSSTEGLTIAVNIYKYLLKHPFVPRLWSNGVFECSSTTIEDLLRTAKESDFAIIILTADDITKSRGKSKPAPRDNVIFEIGLFMGALSRERTYIVAPRNLDIKIPTDLLGVTCLFYPQLRGKTLAYNLRSVKKELFKLICKYGPL